MRMKVPHWSWGKSTKISFWCVYKWNTTSMWEQEAFVVKPKGLCYSKQQSTSASLQAIWLLIWGHTIFPSAFSDTPWINPSSHHRSEHPISSTSSSPFLFHFVSLSFRFSVSLPCLSVIIFCCYLVFFIFLLFVQSDNWRYLSGVC